MIFLCVYTVMSVLCCYILVWGFFLLIDERTKLSSGSMTLIETHVLFTVEPSN